MTTQLEQVSPEADAGQEQDPAPAVAIGTQLRCAESVIEYEWVAEKSNMVHESTPSETQLVIPPPFLLVANEVAPFYHQHRAYLSPLKNFHFVAETGTGRPGGPVRNLIRSHARRRSHATHPRLIPILENTEDHGKKSRDRRRLLSRGHESRGRDSYPRPSRGPGNNALDPFRLIPAGNPDKAQGLLNHYDSVFRHSYSPIEPREKWVSFAISDPALLHATLFSSALSLSFLKGKLFSPDAVYYQDQTLRIIKTRLLTEPKRMISDTSICAVACLTMFETLMVNLAGVKIHMDGLEGMVKTRGGLQGLASSRLTMNLTSWIDSEASIVLETKPRFERDDPDAGASVGWNQYSSLAIRYKSKLFNLSGLRYLSEETIEVYHRMCYLSELKESASCYLVPKAEMISYSDMLELLERRVVRIVQSDELRSTTVNVSNCAVFSLFGNASLLHIYMFMRDLPRGLPFLQLLSSRIRQILEREDIQRLKLQYPEMMLWIFIMGGMGGIGTPNRGWFARQLAEACLLLGILGGNQIAFTLSEFLWSELYLSPVTMGFWNDVAIAQGVEKAYEVHRLTDDVSVAPFNAPPDLE